MNGVWMMVLIFVVIVCVAIGFLWYNNKYNKKIDVGCVIIFVFGAAAVAFFLLIRNMSVGEKENIIKEVSLRNTVVEILTDTRKRYFKNMRLDDGRVLPMPEPMNTILQPGDSIYKNKGENFYTVVNSNSKLRTKFEVKVHERILSEPQ
jgi:hypothetical protein